MRPGLPGAMYTNPVTGARVPLHEISHGEAFLGFIQDGSRDNGLYFLDEPEAALSPARQLTLLYEMDQLAHHGSQLIVGYALAHSLGASGCAHHLI